MLLYFVGDACVSISFFVLWPYFYKDSLGRKRRLDIAVARDEICPTVAYGY